MWGQVPAGEAGTADAAADKRKKKQPPGLAGRLFAYLEKRKTVVWSQVSPGRSTQEGKEGSLGLSG